MYLAVCQVLIILTVTIVIKPCPTRQGQFRVAAGVYKQRSSIQDPSKNLHTTTDQEKLRIFGPNLKKPSRDIVQVLNKIVLENNPEVQTDPQGNLGNPPNASRLMKSLIGHLFPQITKVVGKLQQGQNKSLDVEMASSGVTK